MPNALNTGVAGLASHQRMLEVVGNNLANLNTTGYKARRALFSDLLYETIRSATGSAAGTAGGVNPAEIGSGSKVSQVDIRFAQGNLENTGESLDFGIQGNGFFVVNDGRQDLYTRAGAFSLDDAGTLVDPATGYQVQRYGNVGEPGGTDPTFQTPGDNRIYVPFGAVIPGQTSTAATLSGNLPADASGPVAQVITSFIPWTAGGSAATAGTLLNGLDQNTAAYMAGDSIAITGTDHDGTAVSTTLAVDGTTTMGDLLSAIGAAFPGATAALAADGRITLTSDTTGQSQLSLMLSDSGGNAGGTNFASNPDIVGTTGQAGDSFDSTLEVFDSRGGAHSVSLTYTKQADGTWSIDATLPAGDGTIVDGSVQQIRFNDDGSFLGVDGTGTGDPAFTFQFPGSTSPQTVTLDFGASGSYEGLTELATAANLVSEQDGFPPGSLVSVRMRSDGIIEGVATNGRTFPLAQLAIASFRNPDGLLAQGDNYFLGSLASGPVQVGTAGSGDRGLIRGGQLEASNVDIAQEFTRLIVAQRGFSANARTITVTSQMLEELTNLIR